MNHPFQIVLHEPEIPQNTGNIGRTCVATGSALHLIRPLGFEVSEKACRRAGLDYWPRLAVAEHDSWDAYLSAASPPRVWLFTTYCTRPVYDARFEPGDHLCFGKESEGFPPALLERYADRLLVLPMMPGERSLNLSTSVTTVLYEGLRQLIARGIIGLDDRGRLKLDGLNAIH